MLVCTYSVTHRHTLSYAHNVIGNSCGISSFVCCLYSRTSDGKRNWLWISKITLLCFSCHNKSFKRTKKKKKKTNRNEEKISNKKNIRIEEAKEEAEENTNLPRSNRVRSQRSCRNRMDKKQGIEKEKREWAMNKWQEERENIMFYSQLSV